MESRCGSAPGCPSPARCLSRCRILGPVSPRRACPTFSIVFSVKTHRAPERQEGRGWDCRSAKPSRTTPGGRLKSKAKRAEGRRVLYCSSRVGPDHEDRPWSAFCLLKKLSRKKNLPAAKVAEIEFSRRP